ncbi:metal-dependent hydrolase [Bifidobacterium lemurum]|uniref:Metal-dependent hydrolase n=1 Tax=Bifidobacterium lemurum TaxID=1603886 RepID=A0A261FQP1_9BIFI|nr:SprT family zinc-dependent metalloprotease [Bifidobacterium lemurum]OZG61500.1 metal-dependent hydrolase [Bifidobacterium lemurum]
MTLNIDGLEIEVTRKSIKNMYVRVRPPDGRVTISAPYRMPQRQIEDFVRQHRPWVDRQRRKIIDAHREGLARIGALPDASRDPAAGKSAMSGGTGVPSQRQSVEDGERPTDSASIWTEQRRREAAAVIESALPALLSHWGPIIGRTPTHVTLRLMTSRWGSCTPSTGRIRLNLQLGLMEPRFLEYVLVHEMTHLWARGHGAEFQRRMGEYLPNWRRIRRELNRQAIV